MKLIAFCAGRKSGNTETFIKEALMAAEECGVEVELIRLAEYNLKPCIACSSSCPVLFKEPETCVCRDDGGFLNRKFMESDAFIVGGPAYSATASSLFYAFRDRVIGPKLENCNKEGSAPEWAGERFWLNRPCAVISVGGALAQHWTALSLPSMYTACFPHGAHIVDHMDVHGVADMGAASVSPDWIARAGALGRNLADAMISGDHSWRGETDGYLCPTCHQNLMQISPDMNWADCAVCGRRAVLTVENGKPKLAFTEEGNEENHFTDEGRSFHGREIGYVIGNVLGPVKDQIPEKSKRYKNYIDCIVPPPSKTRDNGK